MTDSLAHSSELALIAALSGAASLLPIPFVDGKVRAHLHAQMFRTLAARKGKSLDAHALEDLAGQKDGSLFGAAGKFALLYPLKRLFRRVFGVLAISDIASEISKTYHLGFLFASALEDNADAKHSMREIRAALDATMTKIDTRPVSHLFRSAVKAWSTSRTKGDTIETSVLTDQLSLFGRAHFENAVRTLRDALEQSTPLTS